MSVATASAWEPNFIDLLPLIERITQFVARRHRLSREDTEDFASEVRVKLIENDYAILRKFENRSSLRTFLTTVVSNALQDYRNRQWGKWRPSADARRLGPDAILLEQLLVRDGLTFDDAAQAMTTNHGVTLGRSELEQIAGRLPVRYRRRFESEDVLTSMAVADRPDDAMLAQERQILWNRIIAVLQLVQRELDSTDALILAMRFQDGRKISEIARTLGLDARPLYDRVYKLLDRLRLALEAEGVGATLVRELLDDAD